ncbi:hypothetical protein GCWU000325_01518 [Alloprevotella tannerae ATCC 51259]|uniref:Uncharacterized protein n=1 Tax=Alloprevotella tannerae ATCC 51259 TaxID=626522 RepID=C9LH17_9BACT|nr:hypothetical protein GCWU000325_01518 [Alloprevotella tannerae ATCC 51259]
MWKLYDLFRYIQALTSLRRIKLIIIWSGQTIVCWGQTNVWCGQTIVW